jgi:hypothetical protein
VKIDKEIEFIGRDGSWFYPRDVHVVLPAV